MKTKMIKLAACFVIAAFVVLTGCASTPKPVPASSGVNTGRASRVSAGGDELDHAIREISDYLNKRIPKGTKAVFLNIKSDWPDLSEYILSSLMENAVNDEVFTIVDRQQLDLIRAEQNFQWSGEVSDASAQEIGQLLGAQTIVSGTITTIGTIYRIQARALSVQTAAVQGQFSQNVSNKDQTVAALTTKVAPAGSAPQTNSNNAAAYIKRGDEYKAKNDYDRAIAEYNQALRLDPNNEAVYNSLAIVYVGKSDYDRALTEINQALRLAPNKAYLYTNRGIVYFAKKDYDLAIADFEAALRIDPNYASAKEFLEKSRQARGGSPAAPAQTATPATPAQSAKTYKVGDTGPAGGLIFYDKGNNNGGWRYLEAAPADINRQLQALSEQIDFTDFQERVVGKGKSNTDAIMKEAANKGGGFGWAAQACVTYTLNGFSDWFLPSKDELHYMYGNLHMQGLGNFKNEWYWSSTVVKMYHWVFWAENFSNGKQDTGYYSNTNRVRPIRQVAGL